MAETMAEVKPFCRRPTALFRKCCKHPLDVSLVSYNFLVS